MRVAAALATTALGLAIGAAPAAADFHPSCNNSLPIGAGVALTASSSGTPTFTYTGSVACGGATITITSLILKGPNGTQVASAPQTSCSGCGTLTDSATYPNPAPGTYVVIMNFTSTGNGQTFSPSRATAFAWDGTTLEPFCNGNAYPGISAVSLTLSAGTFNFSGTAACAGVDQINIDSLVLTLPNLQNIPASSLGSCSRPCFATVTASGSTPAALPGRYTVIMTRDVLLPGYGANVTGLTTVGNWIWAGISNPLQTCPNGLAGPLNCL